MVVWLDVKQAQHAGTALDVNSSLISIEALDRTTDVLPSVARRIRCQVRDHDSVLLLGTTCALLLPTTPFSGAQAVARRISPLLSEFPCELHVYHGTTALLVLQHLREAGAGSLTHEECDDGLSSTSSRAKQVRQEDCQEITVTPLPYLAFLTDYPSPRLLHLLPYELACRYQCVPVGSERKALTLATYHWLNREVVTQLRAVTHRDIFQVRCETTIIEEILCYWQRIKEVKGRNRATLDTDELCSRSR